MLLIGVNIQSLLRSRNNHALRQRGEGHARQCLKLAGICKHIAFMTMLHRYALIHGLLDIRSCEALFHSNAIRSEKALAEIVMLQGSNRLRADYRISCCLHAPCKQQRFQTALRQLLCQRNTVRYINIGSSVPPFSRIFLRKESAVFLSNTPCSLNASKASVSRTSAHR